MEAGDDMQHATATLGPFAKLPIEWLVQVMDWLPTTCLFRIMRTNREWECGARYVLKHRDSVHLVSYGGYSTLRTAFDVKVSPYSSAAPMSSIMKGMKNLKHLKVDGPMTEELVVEAIGLGPGMKELLQANAANLISLSWMVDVTSIMSLMFPKLKKLECFTFDCAAAAAGFFPKLEEIDVLSLENVTPQTASSLPTLKRFTYWKEWAYGMRRPELELFLASNSHHLTSMKYKCEAFHLNFDEMHFNFLKLEKLDIDNFTFPTKCPALKSLKVTRGSLGFDLSELNKTQITELEVKTNRLTAEEIKSLFQNISQMVNMKHFKLFTRGSGDEHFLMLFQNMTHLETVVIDVDGGFRGKRVADWTRIIHQNNVNLRSLEIITHSTW
jgi:hypothetical protein